MDTEILLFTESIGAKAPNPSSENYLQFKAIFKRSNYFIFRGSFMIVKISRSKKPFWGVGKKYLDLLDHTTNYYVVLLINEREGYVFQKSDIKKAISRQDWKLAKDENFKINFPISGRHAFTSRDGFMKIAEGG